MSIRYSLDNNAERQLRWKAKWLEIIRNNSVDFYFEPLKRNGRNLLCVSVHSIGLIFPIAIIVNGQLITEDNIEPSQEAFDAFLTAAMCDVETISVSNGITTVDTFYPVSCLIYKRLKNYEGG
jgi:hypothetical protein